jgi:hypothetical protein
MHAARLWLARLTLAYTVLIFTFLAWLYIATPLDYIERFGISANGVPESRSCS